MAVYDLTQGVPSSIQIGDVLNCPYSGSFIALPLKKGTYVLECWGAMGGFRSSNTYAGKGGYSKGRLVLSSNTTLYLYAGGAGNTGGTNGGFNGGGMRYSYPGGGGGSDIRIGSNSLYARVIVAGGGGSDGASSRGGGGGGGLNGLVPSTTSYGTCSSGYGMQNGISGGRSYMASSPWTTANPTSQASTYSGFGFGGAGPFRSSGYGGAGGGGWYGGGGNYPDSSGDDDAGGRGGSGYVYTAESAANYPNGCLLNSSYYLSGTSMLSGNQSMVEPNGSSSIGHIGNGYVRITVVEPISTIYMISNPSIVPTSVRTQESYTVSAMVTEVDIHIVGSEAAFEFPFENRYLDIFDLIVEEVTYEILS